MKFEKTERFRLGGRSEKPFHKARKTKFINIS
nr:MAG TPA: hypothetical protein [Inoviridae sp.]